MRAAGPGTRRGRWRWSRCPPGRFMSASASNGNSIGRRTGRGASAHSRREFLQAAAATGAAVIAPLLLPVSLARGAARTRPNLVFFLGEGARWDESSLAGNRLLKTPNIDRIGREGAVFTDAFCINSLCLPSRATILSGLYSHTTGAVDNQHSKVPDRFPIVSLLHRASGVRALRPEAGSRGAAQSVWRPGACRAHPATRRAARGAAPRDRR